MNTKEDVPNTGNGVPLDNVPPPLSQEEFADIVAEFRKRGLPVILYVFNGPESVMASRYIEGVGPRQLGAIAMELDEWSRFTTRNMIAALMMKKSGVARVGSSAPPNFK